MADKKLNEVPVVSDIVTIFGKRSNGEIVQIDKNNLATLLGGLIGTATPEKDGLMNKMYVVRSITNAGLVIDYKTDSNMLYTSTSLIELYIYSLSNVAYYRVIALPSNTIKIYYIGSHWCDFKYKDYKLYVLPKSTDIDIRYKISFTRRYVPIFSEIPTSDFSNITGEIITPTPD